MYALSDALSVFLHNLTLEYSLGIDDSSPI
jgi:hypothetical protein